MLTGGIGGGISQSEADVRYLPEMGSAALQGNLTTGKYMMIMSATLDNNTACGLIYGGTAGETVAIGELVYIKSDGKFWLADADAAASMPAIGVVLDAGAAEASVKVLLWGLMRNDAWNWTVGATLYVDTTAGALTETAPSGSGDQVQAVAVAIHADKILFKDFTLTGVA